MGLKTIAPLYPMFSGAVAAIEHIGGSIAFPSAHSTQGANCDRAFLAINTWGLKTNVIGQTVATGYAGWLALLVGVTAFLRTTNRGGRLWEPATLALIACLPPVVMCIQGTFHPEDLFAMGLALAAMACARRQMWVIAGIAISLSVLSQQFALVVAVPLLVLAPSRQRLRFVGGALVASLIIVVPLIAVTPGPQRVHSSLARATRAALEAPWSRN